MSSSPQKSRKLGFPWTLQGRESSAGILPVHSNANKANPIAFDGREGVDMRSQRKPRRPSFLSRKGLPALDNELFNEAKAIQPTWPSFFDVPKDAARDRTAAQDPLYESVTRRHAEGAGQRFYQGGKRPLDVMTRPKMDASIVKHIQDIDERRMFILTFAKCLLTSGSPSHRTDALLNSVSRVLDAKAAFVHIPDIIIITFGDDDVASVETHFVKAKGRIALTALYEIYVVYRKVLHKEMLARDATLELKAILSARPIYSVSMRCFFAFVTASMISAMVFGGSIIDMWISGLCAGVLQYLGLNAASKSATYANVYEISVAIIVSFVSRALSTIPGDLFCYNAISAAGVVLILPGFTILISALELTSHNILCGSVRMVYAIIYTLFLGFGLAIGSDVYLVINPHARRTLQKNQTPTYRMLHGFFQAENGTFPLGEAVFGFAKASSLDKNYMLRGCHRDPNWPWWRQPLPWWLLPLLVPTYSISSSLANMQKLRSWQLPVMVIFACASFAANKLGNTFLPDSGNLVSAFGALIIGLLGNLYSRIVRGTGFTSTVTGVLFLVPFGIAEGGTLIDTDSSSAVQYSSGFSLAIRMIRVAIGITLGLFVSQILVYIFARRKHLAHFAF